MNNKVCWSPDTYKWHNVDESLTKFSVGYDTPDEARDKPIELESNWMRWMPELVSLDIKLPGEDEEEK